MKINEISIEQHSFCNRQCAWCSNSIFKRDFYEELDESAFIRMLNSISQNIEHFDSNLILSCCRYNEPTYNFDLMNSRHALIRKILPTIRIQGNTNGDFLTKEGLLTMDLDRLNILDYDMKGQEECKRIMNDLGIEIIGMDPKENGRINGKHSNVKSITYRSNFFDTAKLQDRGGVLGEVSVTMPNGEEKVLINKVERDSPCHMVLKTVSIDYTGDVFLCYNMRSDNPDHAKYNVGNINDEDFFKIITGEKAKEIQKLSEMNKDFPSECKYCTNKRKI